MGQIINIAIGFFLAIAVGGIIYLVVYLLKSYIDREIGKRFKEIDTRRANFFARVKSDSTQNKSKFVANNPENVQNVSGSNKQPEDEPPLWNNKEKLIALRKQIGDGNFDDYREDESLANLPPLEALWRVDERIAQMEEMES